MASSQLLLLLVSIFFPFSSTVHITLSHSAACVFRVSTAPCYLVSSFLPPFLPDVISLLSCVIIVSACSLGGHLYLCAVTDLDASLYATMPYAPRHLGRPRRYRLVIADTVLATTRRRASTCSPIQSYPTHIDRCHVIDSVGFACEARARRTWHRGIEA